MGDRQWGRMYTPSGRVIDDLKSNAPRGSYLHILGSKTWYHLNTREGYALSWYIVDEKDLPAEIRLKALLL